MLRVDRSPLAALAAGYTDGPPVVGGLPRQTRRGRSRRIQSFDEPDDDTLRVLLVADTRSTRFAPSRFGPAARYEARPALLDLGVRLFKHGEVEVAVGTPEPAIERQHAARKEISEGLLVRVLADWDMGEVEQHAVFPAGKAAKPSARAFVDYFIGEFVKALDGRQDRGT